MNGLAQHGGILPVGGTFFAFSDYMRPAVRLAALTGSHVIYSWTHDSIGLGEDGPTHQPVEQLASLRAMPGLTLIRPADANETAQAWRLAVDAQGPVGLVLTRQNVPVLAGTAERAPEGVARGAYVLRDAEGGAPQIVLVGTGSEVQHCVVAAVTLADLGVQAQVVSFPCWESFERQDDHYRASVFPPGCPCSASKPVSRWAGTVTPTTPSASTTSAPRPPAPWSWRNSASRPSTWSSGHRHSWHAEMAERKARRRGRGARALQADRRRERAS